MKNQMTGSYTADAAVLLARATSALTSPRLRLTNKQRKELRNLRAKHVAPFSTERKDPAVKLATKLQKLPLLKVLRRRNQFARRASTAKHLLDKMAPASPFRRALVFEQSAQLGRFNQAVAEIDARALAATGRLAE